MPDAGDGRPWRNLITGTEYEPGRWYTERYDYHALPVLALEAGDVVAPIAEAAHAEREPRAQRFGHRRVV